ncbi:small conductance mechanosensitive Ion channel family protein [Aeromonas hydrophila 4AK4]|nr:small conductance mechanosensitive Ion channel family protein [Aeromonas hydrophila 4AK4]
MSETSGITACPSSTHEIHPLILEKLNQLGMPLPHQQIDIRMSQG